jgi:hypothetical protein
VLLASVHLSPAFTVPIAVAISAVVVWYGVRLGREDVPASRRKIRRFSLAIMLLSLPMFVRALSFVDPVLDKRQYAVAWTAATIMVLIVIAAAFMDAVNNLRLHQRQQHEELTKAATDLALAIRERRVKAHASGKGTASAKRGMNGEGA